MYPYGIEEAFAADAGGLELGMRLMLDPPRDRGLPDLGAPPVGPRESLNELAGSVLSTATRLDAPGFFAHMDPATPWITWVAAQWAARLNQNLLHEDTGATARELERRVIGVLAPIWGMDGGHLVPGSTVANLTALWTARSVHGIDRVVASDAAHVSVPKAANLLGLGYRSVRTDALGRMDMNELGDVASAAVVLTAGTTSRGAVDPLERPAAPWVHVDAAWAGPLRISTKWGHLLDGVDMADSVAVSAHKWLHQPKESALVLFRDTRTAHEAISFGASYLSDPNVGLLGSHGYAALPLAATIRAYGLQGIASWIDHEMALSLKLVDGIASHQRLEQLGSGPGTGVIAWRHTNVPSRTIQRHLVDAFVSVTVIDDEDWLRSVAANPFADPDHVIAAVLAAAERSN
ncbi:MAG: pyridoxal-dependent decarboxylase [Actinomycetia bacterium]|nr:pyridoxal-dependent decarboxylase [Actinomycetes bacterium]